MKLYNTLTRTVEEFVPNHNNDVLIYTCGPTVYHYAHIGNLRSYIFEDVLCKGLEFLGYNVKRAMNITDVGHLSSDGDTGDDKMLLGAKREHKTVLEIAQMYTEAFKKDMLSLNLKWPDIVVPATSCIDTYFEIISKLLEKGFAYISEGNVYFDTSKLKEYYVLTGHKAEDLMVGVRDSVEEDVGKKNAQDFVLWFTKSKFDNQELKWESPWGIGYPGWHIECSGISYKYLGEHLDIHCGGVDNKFPHHTNEIAQSESFLGHKWCNYWFHVEHLNMADGKMSKSKGEFITVDLLKQKGYAPEVYKLFVLQSFYRKVLVFTYEGLDMAKSAYEKLCKRILKLNKADGKLQLDKMETFKNQFKNAISNDLNTSLMVTALYDVLKSDLNDASKYALICDFDKVLGLSLDNIKEEQASDIDDELKLYIEQKIEERKQAKQNKDFALADLIREELAQKGIAIKDTREGTVWEIVI